jgi:predicted dehydrogenase
VDLSHVLPLDAGAGPRWGDGDVIRLGIVGCNFGRTVLLPAFRADPRCRVEALAGTDAAKTAEIALAEGIGQPVADWRILADHPDLDAIAIAVPPRLQPDIAIRALNGGKAVFVEKPIAADLGAAQAMADAAAAAGRPVMIDFEFCELPAWRRAKDIIGEGTLGALRHVIVTWHVENYATRMRLKSWKTDAVNGGGVLGNFVSHCFYYLEDFCGPMRDISANIFGLPGEPPSSESSVSLSGTFQSGAAYMLSMSAGSYLGSGHRIEFYGEGGTLVLSNMTSDYMRGFELHCARRPATTLDRIEVPDPHDAQYPDGRIAPVSRLAKRFIDAVESGAPVHPDIGGGLRVQKLIQFARVSHQNGSQSIVIDQ